MQLESALEQALATIRGWQAEFGTFEDSPALAVDDGAFQAAYADLFERLRDNYPFFHPRYVGQMLKPPHPAAVAGYVAAMLINPNNHALDGGPATARMEREVVAGLAAMFGFGEHLGHLTSSGTIANLEALFIARESHPGKGIAYSADAHYTHARMCHVLGVAGHAVPVDSGGRMDVTALAELLEREAIGTVVVTAGTTGLGAIDPVDEVVALCRARGARVHVDAAYGGFFRLIADDADDGVAAAPFRAIAQADSVVVDPHKHGLQPYGCGAVLFRDPDVGRFYQHDSPYTYFTSDELHLGEISLECSRAGASAAALWLTMQVVPFTPEGLGAGLRAGRRAAQHWADLIEASDAFDLFQRPQVDIVAFHPAAHRMSEIDRRTRHVFDAAMALPPNEAIYTAEYTVTPEAFVARGRTPERDARWRDARWRDAQSARILRCVVMKPESESAIDGIHERLVELAAQA
jgi:glutamate/tyrosine decarboxylase-like PLP-dependent enzyme